jgi:hypothetical protein
MLLLLLCCLPNTLAEKLLLLPDACRACAPPRGLLGPPLLLL